MRIIFLIIGAQTCGILVSFIGLPGKNAKISGTRIAKRKSCHCKFARKLLICSRRNFANFLNCDAISGGKKIFSFFYFSLDMLGMIGFGGEHPWTCLVKIYRSNLLSLFPTVFYKNVGWGNFEGYEKLEAVLRWDVFFCLKLLQVLQSLKGKLKANHQREIIMSPKERDGNIKIFLPLKLRKKGVKE